MPRGGARSRSGPAPDPLAQRRERPSDAAEWTMLPSVGRKGRTPKWPLTMESSREATLWAEEWKRPQAVEWERLGLHKQVALYVRTLSEAEGDFAKTDVRALIIRQEDALGISLPGLLRNKWRIGQAVTALASAGPTLTAANSRLRVVRDDDVA